jgi:three-Cys-motif partner protein
MRYYKTTDNSIHNQMKDIHKKAFDEGTEIKLKLFKLYLRQWLPVFIKQKVSTIEIYDFFSGPGADIEGKEGSPLIILDELKAHCNELLQKNIRVNLFFNDSDSSKIQQLEQNINTKLGSCAFNNQTGICKPDDPKSVCPFSIEHRTEDFSLLFQNIYPGLYRSGKIPRLLFIDQYGMKQIPREVFLQLIRLQKTDIIFFVSSMHIRRFRDQPEFKKYLSDKKIDFEGSTPYQTHRIVFEYYKSLISNEKRYYLGQFAIKKNANIYGVIFGSSHPLGLKKFLDVAWKIDPHTGDANFDIDRDAIRQGQPSFDFEGDGSSNKVKKLVAYERDLIDFLKTGRTNIEVYLFSIDKGISIPKTNEILKSLENKQCLKFTGDKRQRGGFYLDYDHEKRIKIYSL